MRLIKGFVLVITITCGLGLYVGGLSQTKDHEAHMSENSKFEHFRAPFESLVLDVEVHEPTLRRIEGKPFYELSLPLKLTLRNQGTESSIAIKQAIQLIEIRMSKTREGLNSQDYWSQPFGLPSFKNPELLKLLALPQPNNEVVFLVSPEQDVEWEQVAKVFVLEKQGDRSYSRAHLSLEELTQLENLWIEGAVSFFPMNTMKEEGNQLKLSWRKSGRLVLESLSTKPVKVVLPRLS